MIEIWAMGELLAEVMRPRAGLPLGDVGPFTGPLPSGAPGIFIDTVARLGRSGGIISGVGVDEFGQAILERLERDGVHVELIEVVPDRPTGVAFIAYADDGSRSYVFHWDGTAAVAAKVPPPEIAAGACFFHVMGCSLMPNAGFAQRIVETAEQFADAGARISFDPNLRAELSTEQAIAEIVAPILQLSSILMPGATELLMLGGAGSLDASAATLMRRHDLEMVVVKLGARGCVLYTDDRRIEVPAFDVVEVDPTGAGDCFDAAFLCALLDGQPPEEALRWGAAAGALNAAAFGPMEGRIDPDSMARLLQERVPRRVV